MTARGGDWSHLPSELLESISKRLSVADYFRSGAVCRSWTAALRREGLSKLPPAPPMLIVSGELGGTACFDSADGRPLDFPLASLQSKRCVGSHRGWLAVMDVGEPHDLRLLNPLTGAQILLPSDGGFLEDIKKIVLSACPSPVAGSYTAMAFSISGALAVLTQGEDCWRIIRPGFFVTDGTYRDGECLMISHIGELSSIDLRNGRQMKIADDPQLMYRPIYDKHLVVSSDDLLQVWIRSSYVGEEAAARVIVIMKLDSSGGNSTWVQTKSLGGNSLFLGLNCSISLSPTEEIFGLKRNCIYFTEPFISWYFDKEKEETPNVGWSIWTMEAVSFIPMHVL